MNKCCKLKFIQGLRDLKSNNFLNKGFNFDIYKNNSPRPSAGIVRSHGHYIYVSWQENRACVSRLALKAEDLKSYRKESIQERKY